MPSDQEFLLYPLDTGEDPACLDCGTLMMVAGHEVRESQAGLHHLPMPKLRADRKVCLR